MSVYIPTYRTLAVCLPPEVPRRCRWWGHKWLLNEAKTYPDRVQTLGQIQYYECTRCMAREAIIALLSEAKTFDRAWVGAIFGVAADAAPVAPPDRKVWKP